MPPQTDARGEGVTLLPQGGSGNDMSFRQTIWVEPLPPDGPATFAAAWPDQGVAAGHRDVRRQRHPGHRGTSRAALVR